MRSDSFGLGSCGCKIDSVSASSQLEADEAMVRCLLLKYLPAVIRRMSYIQRKCFSFSMTRYREWAGELGLSELF